MKNQNTELAATRGRAKAAKLPSSWNTVSLGEIAHIIMGNSPPGDSYNEGGEGVPLVNGPVEFSEGDFGLTIKSKFTTSPTKMCAKDDLLLCVRGSTTGRTNLAAFEACIGRGVAAIRARQHQSYINHFIRTQRQKLFVSGNGSTFPSISQNQIAELQIPLPYPDKPSRSVREQKRIAAILDKADAVLCKSREARDLTNDLPLSLFRDLFRDFLQPSRCDTVLETVAEVVSGVAKGRQFNGAETREVSYLRVANVQAGYLNLSEIKTIPATPSEIAALSLQHGDVVMTEGGDFDKLGRGALWDQDLTEVIHQNHVFRVRTNRSKLLPTFFVHFLQTDLAKAYFLRCAKKTTNLASINMRQLRALPLTTPPLPLQQRFESELSKINAVSNRQSLFHTEAGLLFDSLVQRAFRGEL